MHWSLYVRLNTVSSVGELVMICLDLCKNLTTLVLTTHLNVCMCTECVLKLTKSQLLNVYRMCTKVNKISATECVLNVYSSQQNLSYWMCTECVLKLTKSQLLNVYWMCTQVDKISAIKIVVSVIWYRND